MCQKDILILGVYWEDKIPGMDVVCMKLRMMTTGNLAERRLTSVSHSPFDSIGWRLYNERTVIPHGPIVTATVRLDLHKKSSTFTTYQEGLLEVACKESKARCTSVISTKA